MNSDLKKLVLFQTGYPNRSHGNHSLKEKININQELDRLVSIYEHGGGFGDPDAKAEHDRKIQLLMHHQIQKVNKSNTYMALANVVIAIVNIGILIYQVFFK
jgi:hypothetical protein